jgi:hypothetical protein
MYQKCNNINHTVSSFNDRVLLRYGSFTFTTPPPQGYPAEKRYQIEPPKLVAACHAMGSGKSDILTLGDPVNADIEEAADRYSI